MANIHVEISEMQKIKNGKRTILTAPGRYMEVKFYTNTEPWTSRVTLMPRFGRFHVPGESRALFSQALIIMQEEAQQNRRQIEFILQTRYANLVNAIRSARSISWDSPIQHVAGGMYEARKIFWP